MKKNLLTLFVVFGLAGAFSFTAHAQQNNQSPTIAPVSTSDTNLNSNIVNPESINIDNTKIVSQKDRDFMISFDVINNTSGIKSEIKYSLQLIRVFSSTSRSVVDEKIFDDSLSIDKGATLNKKINYSIPSTLSDGTYYFLIEIGNKSGMIFAAINTEDVEIKSNINNVIEVVPNSCQFFISDKLHEAGPIFADIKDTITEKCKINSSLSGDIVLSPKFETRFHNLFGNIAETNIFTSESITIKKGINNISFTVPKGVIPQDYFLTFHLESADGKISSNIDSFTYFLRGLTGSVENATFDKPSYKANDMANIEVYSLIYDLGTTTGVTGTLTAIIKNDSGEPCGVTTTIQVSLDNTVVKLPIKITKDCINPTVNIILSTIDEKGNMINLDVKDFKIVTPVGNSSGGSIPWNIILMSILVLLLVSFISRIVWVKTHSVIIGILIFIISSFSLYLGFTKNVWATDCYPNPTSRYAFCNSTIGNASMYDLGGNSANGLFYWSGRNVSYGLSGGGWIAWPKNPLNGIYVLCDGGSGGAACWKESFSTGSSQNFSTRVVSQAASPVSMEYGASSNISWNSVGATWCDILTGTNGNYTGWKYHNATNGSQIWSSGISTGILSQSTNFHFICGGYAPDGAGDLAVTVNPLRGSFDTATGGNGTCNVKGWACDLDNPSAQLNVNLYDVKSVPTTVVDTATWIKCANEGGVGTNACIFGGTRDVRYGADTRWAYKYGVVVNVDCNNANFGDPAPGTSKACYTHPDKVIYVPQNNLLNTVLAGSNDSTLSDACGNTINHVYNFNFPTGSPIWDGQPHTISVSALGVNSSGAVDGQNLSLPGSTKTITCTPVIPISASIDANPKTVIVGNPSLISWTSSGADACTIKKDGVTFSSDTWTSQNVPTNAIDSKWSSIAYGNGKFVAVGYVSDYSAVPQIMTSTDGVNWTTQSVPMNPPSNIQTTQGWGPITYANGLFVVLRSGNDKSVMTSSDGVNWTLRTTPNYSRMWNGITYGNGRFVAVGDTVAMTSTDGINWAGTTGLMNMEGVAYGNGVFSAIGAVTAQIATSSDGITWSVKSAPKNVRAITYGNGMFVAVGSDSSSNAAMSSPDGSTWTARTTPGDSYYWYNVTYGNKLFVATAYYSYSSRPNTVMTSPDGITWTAKTPPTIGYGGVTYGNGRFVAVGTGKVMTSSMTAGSIPSGPLSPIGSTVFSIACTNINNSTDNNSPKPTPVTITINPKPSPKATIKALPSQISWDLSPAVGSCTLTQDSLTGPVISTAISGTYVSDISAGIQYWLKCIADGQTYTTSTISIAPAVESQCIPSQTGSVGGNIYVNKKMTWSVSLDDNGSLIDNTVWSGTNVTSAKTYSTTLDKIYTTVGTKTINATTTGTSTEGYPFITHCSSSVPIKLERGSTENI